MAAAATVYLFRNPQPSEFYVFSGNHISPDDQGAMEHLVRYITLTSFSRERQIRLLRQVSRP